MKNKIFLTSIFAIAFACPAMAVDGNATIENGDTCNIDNLGTSENNSTANIEAIWTLQSIDCPAGTSFNASTASCDTCASGSWCVAGTYDVENNATGDGATLCSTLSGGYNSSAEGAKANTDCYKSCVASDVEHALEVSGNVYYNGSTGNKQCVPTSCVAGWHVKPGVPDLVSTIGTRTGTTRANINAEGVFSEDSRTNYGQSFFGINGTNTWAAYYSGKGIVTGISFCSTQTGTSNWSGNNSTAATASSISQEHGQGCWCKVTGYKSEGNELQSVSAIWVFNRKFGASGCDSLCAEGCSDIAGSYLDTHYLRYRNSILGAANTPTPATCAANNIALQWYNDTVSNNGTKITPNNDAANQCTYNETITVPTNEIQKPGYTFGGWKLRTTTTTPVEE